MKSLTPPKSVPSVNQRGPQNPLRVNNYDRTATLIIASLILAGFTVVGLSLVFFADKFKTEVRPIAVVPVEATSPGGNQGISDEPDPPGSEEADELSDPQVQEKLSSLASAVSSKEVLLWDEQDEQIVGRSRAAGKGKGLGDSRMPGPGGEGVIERVPRWERWKIRFEPESIHEFARWLDYNKIEVAVLGRDNLVHYAFDLSGQSPRTREGKPAADNRGWTSAAYGPMPTLTVQLARKANIAEFGPIVLLFYPFEVESLLWTLENEYSKGINVNKVRETVFTVVRTKSEYEFKVLEQSTF